jgi:NADPH-dependent glutamate synthase beta subunit-like oxidoreductase
MGHQVTVIEAGEKPGGMMRFGIPKYRLPRDVLDAEVARIAAIGVDFRYGEKVADIAATMRDLKADAAFLAIGAHIAKRAYIPAKDSSRILDAVTVLRSMEGEAPPMLGRRVVVYGGGNTAIDVARTARRLGATEAIIVYRRTREKMPAHDFELEEALEEGVKVKWLSTITGAEGGKLTIEKMVLDADGKPQPTGEFETLDTDSLVLALGQDVDMSLAQGHRGTGERRWRGAGQSGDDDDRPSGPVCRRRHGTGRAQCHGRHRPRQEGGTAYRRMAARREDLAKRRPTQWLRSTS